MITHNLRNANGLETRILSWGGIIQSLRVPDRDGRMADVVLGYDDPEHYLENPSYLGALIGRYANRIGGGRFSIDGRTHVLTLNDGRNHLHGGRRGFNAVEWDARRVAGDGGEAIELTQTSPDGEEGYPGRLEVTVRYTLTDANEVVIDYRATTDAPTHVNLTQHSYFNLAGHDAPDVLGHVLRIDADRYLPVDASLIPNGKLASVTGTPFDFREPFPIGRRIETDDVQMKRGRGYDHCFVLNAGDGAGVLRGDAPDGAGGLRGGPYGGELRFAARVEEPSSGRTLEVWTTEPGMQLYTGNFLDIRRGKGGARYGSRAGLALETQHFPDSPNKPSFPSTVVRPGEEYRSRTVWAFGVTP